MTQKLSVDGFKCVKMLSKFDEQFIEDYEETSNKGYFFEVDVEYPKSFFNLHKDFRFLPEGEKLKNVKSLFVT